MDKEEREPNERAKKHHEYPLIRATLHSVYRETAKLRSASRNQEATRNKSKKRGKRADGSNMKIKETSDPCE